MKQLTCEMCGGTDLVKQDGIFVCQTCGTKYSVEEAKKMMIEGTVDVSGSTVKIDSTSKIDSLYQLARRAKEENNAEDASKYYGQILVERPNDWEAQFYSAYYTAFGCKIGEIGNAAYKVANTITSTFTLIKANMPDEERPDVYKELRANIIILGSALYEATLNYALPYKASSIRDKIFSEVQVMVKAILSMYTSLAIELEKEGDTEGAVVLYEQCIERSNLRGIVIYTQVEKNDIMNKIRMYDPSYSAPQEVGQGCYVATAVYGSYDCPEVWTLRRYRDYNLAETWYGRAFIHIYYAISPTLVKCFGHTEWFKKMWKGQLDRMVSNLRSRGVQDTPYEDRNW